MSGYYRVHSNEDGPAIWHYRSEDDEYPQVAAELWELQVRVGLFAAEDTRERAWAALVREFCGGDPSLGIPASATPGGA